MTIKYLKISSIVVAVLVLSGISLAKAQTFTSNLYFGLQDSAQVQQLQEFLASQGLYSGSVTGNFYFLTLNAVKAFQRRQGISPAAGYFGQVTMAAANKIADAEVGASNSEAISETGTSMPSVQGSSTVQLQLQALLQEVALLQQQLATQQSSTQIVQNLQTQVQVQTQTIQQQAQTLQQIQQNTQAIQQNTMPPVVVIPVPTPNPTPNTPPPTTITLGSIKIIGSLLAGMPNNLQIVPISQNGNPIINASATITIDNPTPSGMSFGSNGITENNNASLGQTQFIYSHLLATYASSDGRKTSNQPFSGAITTYYYPLAYTPQAAGQHTITVSALGSTKSIAVTAVQKPVPQITVSIDGNSPAAGNDVLGTTGDVLGIFRFSETSNNDGVAITNLAINDSVSPTNAQPSFTNLTLWNGSTVIGTADAPVPNATGDGYTYTFHQLNIIYAPQANSTSITLKGDLTSSSSSISVGSTHSFSIISTSSISSHGSTYDLPATITLINAAGNPQTVVSQ